MKIREEIIKDLQKLSLNDQKKVLAYTRWRWLRYHLPFPVRFALLHLSITFAIISQYPPSPQLPAILIPITWAASFAVTVTLFCVVPPRPVRSNV